MTIYLINRETGELINTYNNVTRWAEDFVEYNNGGRAKSYCEVESELFTDTYTEKVVE
ncbi:hypothetical protein IJE86_07830 [bacterium]|nr:hypothetical protein [bacterium]